MAGLEYYKCLHCGFEIVRSGPDEFSRDRKGILRGCVDPRSYSEIKMVLGVKGLFIHTYCIECDEPKDVVIVEFDEPVDDGWQSYFNGEGKRFEPVCNKCGSTLFDKFDKMCPKCKNPSMKFAGLAKP